MDESAGTGDPVGGLTRSPKKVLRKRGERNKIASGHVHWDEDAIAEHDKERGTRQKIDEPDTPYIRSPQGSSDNESDDGHRSAQAGSSSGVGASAACQPVSQAASAQLGSFEAMPPPPGALDREISTELASRLDELLKSGANKERRDSTGSIASSDGADCQADTSRLTSTASSRSSSFSAPAGATAGRRRGPDEGEGSRSAERRISLPDESPKAKPTSAGFKSKRAMHYDEGKALQNLKKIAKDGDSSPESDTSDENYIKTNTNTNVNQTIAKSDVRRNSKGSKQATSHGAQGIADCVAGAASAAAGSDERPRSAGSSDGEGKRDSRGRVSFSEGESGAESTEEFRRQMRDHSAQEWRQDAVVPVFVNSLETNTNTNSNIGRSSSKDGPGREKPANNPMEAGRPPVMFTGRPEGDPTLEASSAPFRAARKGHYNEAAAVAKFKQEHQQDEEVDDEEEDEEVDLPEVASRGAAAAIPAVQVEGAPPASGNPMEPRDPGVVFQIPPGSPQHPGQAPPGGARDIKQVRNAHYSGMAAALRSMPPPSSDEEDSSDD